MMRPENEELRKSLDHCVRFSNLPRSARVIKRPFRFFISKSSLFFYRVFRVIFSREVMTFFGVKMNVKLPDYVSSWLYRYSFYEEDVTAFLLSYLREGDTFVDIGSHIGYFSLLASKLVGPNGEVHNFEPTKCIYEVLSRNCAGISNIRTNNNACWSSEIDIEFHDYGLGSSVINSIFDPRADKSELAKLSSDIYRVRTISIDDYVNRHAIKPNFVKIDAESSELEILKGMDATIGKYMPIITLEVGDLDIKGAARSVILINHLMGKGYSVFQYKDGKIEKHEIQERYDSTNLLFVKN